MDALKVSEYILSLSDPEEGDIISHLKLQKLLYYAQGFHLAVYDTPLFSNKVWHWEHGPVVEEVYHNYKKYSKDAIPVPDSMDLSSFTDEQKEIIDEVYNVYGQFSAWKLRQMTHEEPPWKNTSESEEITTDSMKSYFKTQIA